MYVDSLGCTSCKLQLSQWKEFIKNIDSTSNTHIPLLIFFHPKDKKEILFLLKQNNFQYPICIDTNDELNQRNHFPSISNFQTFLLDKNNKVIIIGNPIHNLAIKELYFRQILGKNQSKEIKNTTYQVNKMNIDMGNFKEEEQKVAKFFIKNTGSSPLVILDISTTRGCTTAQFDSHPAEAGDSLWVSITYTPKKEGQFEEWIAVKCNTTPQIVKFSVKGNVSKHYK